MQFKLPKNDKYQWTQHSAYKMRQYGLSAQRVIRVIRNPQRIEEGIVEKTIAVMQPASIKYKNFKKTWSQEIWVMYQLHETRNMKHETRKANKLTKLIPKKLKIISAWRYPGVSPQKNPIPEEILREIEGLVRW
ncbi:MAG: hypothetical protein NT136_00090 [Candidatus Moranbacteria bacterium]|nr:hypothetical protein [Candidatus Moranbacteria bacterium]